MPCALCLVTFGRTYRQTIRREMDLFLVHLVHFALVHFVHLAHLMGHLAGHFAMALLLAFLLVGHLLAGRLVGHLVHFAHFVHLVLGESGKGSQAAKQTDDGEERRNSFQHFMFSCWIEKSDAAYSRRGGYT